MNPTLAALFVLAAAPAAPADPQDAVVQLLRPAGKGSASGVAVRTDGKATWVVTCRHCVEDGTPTGSGPVRRDWAYGVRSVGRYHPADLVYWRDDIDVAVLRVDAVLPVMPLAPADPAAGSALRSFGYGGAPRGGKCLGIPAEVVYRRGRPLRADLVPASGDSGGAVVNEAGELVGVTWGTMADGKAAAVLVGDVDQVLGEVQNGRPAPAAAGPASPAPATARPPQVFHYAQLYRPQDCVT